MNTHGKKALITGINGFTGHYMAAELSAAGYRVFGLGSSASSTKDDYYQADLSDLDSLVAIIKRILPDVVIHLAAIAFVDHGNPSAFYNVNLMGTRNLLQALASCDKKTEAVLLASSANVYGNRQEGKLKETSSTYPVNDYGVSKLSMEYMAHLWCDELPIIITRPFNYTGVGQEENFLLPKIVKHFKSKASKIELGNINVFRDFTDVRALTNAYLRLIESKLAIGQTINVCSGRIYALSEIMNFCTEITGHEIEIIVNPAFVRANEVKSLSGDVAKLKSIIGNWDTPPIEDTLKWMLEAN